MPSVRIRRPGASTAAPAAAQQPHLQEPEQQQPPSSDLTDLPSSSAPSDAPIPQQPLLAPPHVLTDGEGTSSSALTSIDDPHTDLDSPAAGGDPIAPLMPAPVKRGPGRPRGSGRGRGRPRGSGAGSSSSITSGRNLAAAGPSSHDASSASGTIKLSIRPRRSIAEQEDIAGPSASPALTGAKVEEDNDGLPPSSTPTTRGRGRGRGRPRGRGTDVGASSPPARRGRKSNLPTPSAQDSDDGHDGDDNDQDAGPLTESSRSTRGKRKRGIDDDEQGPDDDTSCVKINDDDQDDDDDADDDDDEDDSDDDEADGGTRSRAKTSAPKGVFSKRDLPPLKKRPSRMRGYQLAFENHQTVLVRHDEEELEERAKRAKKKGRGRKARGGLPRTRIIEDSEDENTDDDRPRPPAPPLPQNMDEDRVMPINERLRVKLMGKPYMMNCDELELEDDPDGDAKVDKNGNLLGDRKWKAPSFTSSIRGNPHKVYFLSVDAARAVGFRDSLTLFRTDLRLIKLSLCQKEKDDLIAMGRLKEQLRGRNVTAVGARNVFKVHGAKTIQNGRAVIDDYYESAARERLESSGRLHSAGQVLPEEDPRSAAEIRRQADKERDRSRRPPDAVAIATNDAQGGVVVTTFGDNGAAPFVRSINHTSRRLAQQRADLTEDNWMLEMALSVRGMNSELEQYRRDRLMQFWGAEEVREDGGEGEDVTTAIPAVEQAPAPPPLTAPAEAVKMEVDAGEEGKVEPTVAVEGQPVDTTMYTASDEGAVQEDAAQSTLHDHSAPPVGLYEPTTNVPHYAVSTQPLSASLQKISERPQLGGGEKGDTTKAVLGGAKIGGGAWGVMSWDTALDLGSVGADERRRRGPALVAGTGGEYDV